MADSVFLEASSKKRGKVASSEVSAGAHAVLDPARVVAGRIYQAGGIAQAQVEPSAEPQELAFPRLGF